MVTYEKQTSIRKIRFSNGVKADIFPGIQRLIYNYRQIGKCSSEAGGILIGYENTETGHITVTGGTAPKKTDYRARARLLLSCSHKEEVQALSYPYGYIGTWHTHPSDIPSPSSVDLQDWKNCLKSNVNATASLVFIIGGRNAFRIWLYDSIRGQIVEGTEDD